MKFKATTQAASLLAMAVFMASPALAQVADEAEAEAATNDGEQGNLIIVTAQMREQNFLDVPIAISVQSADELRAERSTNAYDIIRQVPGVTGTNPSEELTQIAIRGISSEDYGVGSDPTVGVFFDGVYLGRNSNTATNFIDLERAEILRGPQGALFGRATPAGVISMIPTRPKSYTEYSVTGEVGNAGFARGSAILNIPLAGATFLRGSVQYDRRGDFVDNLSNGEELGKEESFTARLALRQEFGALTTLDLTGWFETFEGDPWLYRNFVETVDDGEGAADPLSFTSEIFSDVSGNQLEESRNNWGAIARLEHETDGGLVLSSITSALGYNSDYLEDFDGSDSFLFNYGQFEEQSLLTQEFRVVSPSSSAFRWFAGALAYREDITAEFVQSYGDFDLCVFYEFDDEVGCAPAGDDVTDTFIFADGKNTGFAIYAEGEFDITDTLTINGGARFTRDSKEFTINAPIPGGFLPAEDVGYTSPTDGDVLREETFESFQPRIALTYRPTEQLSLYALYAEGEKPGGFDTFDATSPAFNAEKIESLEAGIKGAFDGGRLIFSLAAYTTNYSDLQVLVADGPRDIVRNAASADGQGLEFEGSWRHDWLEVGVRAALIDSTFGNFQNRADDFSGNRLPYTPKYTIGGTAAINLPVDSDWSIYGRADADYQGTQFLTPANDGFSSQPGFERIDLRMGLRRNDRLEVYVFGQNVTDPAQAAYADITDYDQNFGAYLSQFSRPAVFGIGVNIKN